MRTPPMWVLLLSTFLSLFLGACGGSGQVRMQQGFFQVQQTCPTCRGRG